MRRVVFLGAFTLFITCFYVSRSVASEGVWIQGATAPTYTGEVLGAHAVIPTNSANPSDPPVIDGGLRWLSRTYSDGTRINDVTGDLGSTFKIGHGQYMELAGSVDPNASVLPELLLSATPRWSVGSGDYGLGFLYSHYANLTAATVHPNFVYDLNPIFQVGAGATATRTNDDLFAGHAQAIIKPFAKHRFKVECATGRTLEDAGIEAQFASQGFTWMWDLSEMTTLSVGLGNYDSDIRTEKSASLRLEFK